MIDAQTTVFVLLALALVVGVARLLWTRWRSEAGVRPRAWRTALLVALQIASVTLLYRTLLPPPVATGIDALVVATADAPSTVARNLASHEKLVALPEAWPIAGAEAVPDLGTALRRHPETARLRVVGDGLEARDRDALHGMPMSFEPAPLPRGLIEISAPSRVQAGSDFRVHGRAHDLRGGVVELLDPSGQRVDRQTVDAQGRFMLLGATRTPGLAEFRIRASDSRGQQVEVAAIPLNVYSPPTTRVLVLAGAPDAELKYLRRWAIDSGVHMTTQIQLGGGVLAGDAPVAFNAGALKTFDAVIVDERSWDGLGEARRRVLVDAVRNGLGLLVRVTGPLSATGRNALASWGIRLNSVSTPTTFAFPTSEGNNTFAAARLGPASAGSPASTTPTDIPLPELTRQALRIDSAAGHAWLRDRDGHALGTWLALGRGRIGAWLPMDTFQLVLIGREDLHAALWSDAVAEVARASDATNISVPADARRNTRVTLCGLSDGASVVAPGLPATPLLIDPVTGAARCAGFWPRVSGWHTLRNGDASAPFFVREQAELAGIAARQMRDATAQATLGSAGAVAMQATAPGPRWPWFIAWLIVSATMWWLERSRLGRIAPSVSD